MIKNLAEDETIIPGLEIVFFAPLPLGVFALNPVLFDTAPDGAQFVFEFRFYNYVAPTALAGAKARRRKDAETQRCGARLYAEHQSQHYHNADALRLGLRPQPRSEKLPRAFRLFAAWRLCVKSDCALCRATSCLLFPSKIEFAVTDCSPSQRNPLLF